MRRLSLVAIFVLLLAAALSLQLRRDPSPTRTAIPAAPLPDFAIEAELVAGGLAPYRLRVPKNHRVRILIHAGTEAGAGMLSVSGYGDRITAVGIGPGLSREIAFVSDRPGDDFGILLGEDLVGRLEVTGSHLEAGHE